ncbi:hypothetical protein BKA65DRAFT_550203 [Rhexocercosporidium sp. MPI-PUGE-AT-0058]|nr:hypothetical protein BKA65DRAFT_550203 [Rhexocercosporidium sp. MPI-PUGE-AT-0058]
MHLLHPQTVLPILLALTPLTTALSNASSGDADSNLNNHQDLPSNPLSLSEDDILSPDPELKNRQVAAGGGIAATTLAPSQYPISTTAGSLFTVNGVTSATWTLFVQTFATTALGTWELGPTPGVGSIGLGDIQGTVGGVRKVEGRAVETPAPAPES